MLPRESASRRIDFATFVSISFPGFALSNGTDHLADKLYNKTKKEILAELSGVTMISQKKYINMKLIYFLLQNIVYVKLKICFTHYRLANMVLKDSYAMDITIP